MWTVAILERLHCDSVCYRNRFSARSFRFSQLKSSRNAIRSITSMPMTCRSKNTWNWLISQRSSLRMKPAWSISAPCAHQGVCSRMITRPNCYDLALQSTSERWRHTRETYARARAWWHQRLSSVTVELFSMQSCKAQACLQDYSGMLLSSSKNVVRTTSTWLRYNCQTCLSIRFPRMDYCNAVLAGLPASTLALLRRVAAALVLQLRPRDPVTTAMRDLHWLSITPTFDYKLCMFIQKIFVGHASLHLTNLLTANADVPSKVALRAYTRGDYVVARTHSKLGERASSVAAPLACFRLPTTLKLGRCTDTFKRQPNTVLFGIAYNA